MRRLQGKVAVVTASTAGIGFAIVKRLAEDGASVVLSSRKPENVKNAVKLLREKNLEVSGVKCHVGIAEDRKRLFGETIRLYGKLDILISNAAANPTAEKVIDCDERAWDKIFDINVKSSFLLAKEAVPYLRQQQGSSIVFISSIAGYDATSELGAYSVSKTALLGLTKAIAKDLAIEGIRVNCLAPGLIETKFAEPILVNNTAREVIMGRVPMQRIGQPHEMASVVSFLVSDDASYITGETIVASGGFSARL